MRVLLLTSRDSANPALGGGEVVTAEFAKALVAHGHQVTLIAASIPGKPRMEEADGVCVMRLAPESVLGAAAYLEYWRRFRYSTDVVLEDFLGGSRIPFLAPLYVRQPIVAVWHQDHIPIFRHEYPAVLLPALAGLERGLVWAHRRSYLLVPSTKSRDSLVAKGADPRRVRVFHPGIGEDLLRSEALPARDHAPRMVCLGKIRRYKCQHHAILVLREVLRSNPRATLVIAGRVGDADYLEEMRAFARRHEMAGKVAFELNVTEERKRELLQTSRVLLAPAPIEGFGIAIAEASACGLPVVGTDGVPEDSLEEGTNGFRVPFGDIAAMAERAGTLLREDTQFDAMATAARSFAQSFTWERAAEPLLELLKSLASGNP